MGIQILNPVNNINKPEPVNKPQMVSNEKKVVGTQTPIKNNDDFDSEKVVVSNTSNHGSAKEVVSFCNDNNPEKLIEREKFDLKPLIPIKGYVNLNGSKDDPFKLILNNLKKDFYHNQKEETYEVKLTHLKYKDGMFSDWKVNKDFNGSSYFLDETNEKELKENSSKHVFVAEVWNPSPEKVENIIFLSAGQQGSSTIKMAFPAVVTGQPDGWNENEGIKSWRQLKDKNIEITSKSVAGQIIYDSKNNSSKQYGFNPSNTYMVLVFDAGFYWGMDKDKKDKVLDNYTEWLMSKCNFNENNNLKNVYMAGASRGGDLVCRIAYQMRHEEGLKDKLKDTEIIVSSFDGVANQNEGELFTTDETTPNPSGRGKAYNADFNNFKNTDDLHILQIAGGRKVFPLSSARAFIMKKEKEGSYEYEWVDKAHMNIGQHWHDDVTKRQMLWLEKWVKNRR